jgi:ribosomal protein L5
MNRLKDKYLNIAAPNFRKEFGLTNIMDVPRIKKVSVNAGIGGFRDNRESVESCV